MKKIVFILVIISFCSCGTIKTNFKITQGNRSYYTNIYEVIGDSIYFSEVGYHGQPHGYFKILNKNVTIFQKNLIQDINEF
jgi:hypothetical protein